MNKTLRYRQHVRFINDERSERFSDPKKATYKEFYEFVVISYQVGTLTHNFNIVKIKKILIKAGEKNLGLEWRGWGGGGGGDLESCAYLWKNPG